MISRDSHTPLMRFTLRMLIVGLFVLFIVAMWHADKAKDQTHQLDHLSQPSREYQRLVGTER